jgi:putative FmdB family regulatory protein
MPIYAYRCETCGFAKDVLQKISDPQLTDCLSCGKPTFKKQLTAAGFQLKGTGWYVTDFRGGSMSSGTGSSIADSEAKSASDTQNTDTSTSKSDSKPDTKAESKSESKTESKPPPKAESKPAAGSGS